MLPSRLPNHLNRPNKSQTFNSRLSQVVSRTPVHLKNAQRVPHYVPCSSASSGSESLKSEKVPELGQDGGNNGNKAGSGGSGGGGGGGGGGGSSGGDKSPLSPELVAILAAAGRTVESFPSDFAQALLSGKVSAEILRRFLELESNFFAKLVWQFAGFRERLLADPSFPVKLGIEVGIGICTKVTAEYTKRADNFYNELDFVSANVIMAILADFMLTWLPAPTLSFKTRVASKSALGNFLATCPDNAFQKVQAGMPEFSMTQRVAAVLRNGAKLMGVGMFASLLGVTITNSLIFLRHFLDPNLAESSKPQSVLKTSAAYGLYMSTSSNLRYQLVAGVIEERGIETLFHGKPELCAALSFIIRTANTFVGSLLWVDFVRLLGMQKKEEKKA